MNSICLFSISLGVVAVSDFAFLGIGGGGGSGVGGGGGAGLLLQGDVVGEGHLSGADGERGADAEAHLGGDALGGEAGGEVLQRVEALLREELAEVGAHGQLHGGRRRGLDGVVLARHAVGHVGAVDGQNPVQRRHGGLRGGGVLHVDVDVEVQRHLFALVGGHELHDVGGREVAVGQILHVDARNADVGDVLQREFAVGEVGHGGELRGHLCEYVTRTQQDGTCKD